MMDPDQTYFNIRAAQAVLKSDDLLCRHMERLSTPHWHDNIVAVPSPGAFSERNAELHAAGKAVALPLVVAALRTALAWKRTRRGVAYTPLVRALDRAHAMLRCDDYEFGHRFTAELHLSEAANLCATILDAGIRSSKVEAPDPASIMERIATGTANIFLGEMLKRTAAHIRAGKKPADAIKAVMDETPPAEKKAEAPAEKKAEAPAEKKAEATEAENAAVMIAENARLRAALRTVMDQCFNGGPRNTYETAAQAIGEAEALDPRREIDAMLAEIARTQGFDAARRIVRRAGVRSIAAIPDKMTDSLIRACEKALGREQPRPLPDQPQHAEGA